MTRPRRVLLFGPASTTFPAGARTLVRNPVFREAFIEASDFVERQRGWSMWRTLDSDSPPAGVTSAERNFAMETAIQLSLFRAVTAERMEYDAVAGISLGDGAAAHAAGALTFEETLLTSCETIRAVLTASGGDLIAVQSSPARVRQIVDDPAVQMVIDWSAMSVWAVPDDSGRRMGRQLRVAGIPYARLGFNCLSHTSRVDVAGLRKGLRELPSRLPVRTLYSTLEGGIVSSSDNSDRFVRMISEPVRLESMWKELREDGYRDVLYVGSVQAEREIFGGLPRAQKPLVFSDAGTRIPLTAPVPSARRELTGDLIIADVMRSSSFATDPYADYRRWLENGALQQLPGENTFVALGHDAASSILRQSEIFSSKPFHHISSTLLGADAPDHTRMRKLLTPFFSRERQVGQREAIAELTGMVVHDLRRAPAFDAVPALASRIPFGIACDWIGLEHGRAGAIGTMGQEDVTWDDATMVMKPGGALAALAESGDLSRREIQLLLPFLIGAGVTTTRDVILLSIHTLMKRRSLLEELTANPARVPAFIEEMLRYEPPVHGLVRLASQRAEVEGMEIAQGSRVWVILAAANRDPSKFDRPDDFVMERTGTRHISFGNGPHFCMGSHLGRTEAETIVALLLPEIPRLVSKADPEFFFTDIREDLPWMRSMRSWHMSFKR